MGAPALAPRRAPEPRRAPARRRAAGLRRAPARRRPAPRRATPKPALAGAALIPQAAVRTAGAVRDLSDSGLIVRLTRGRSWIGVLCALLGGIVALNVISLSLNAGSGRVSQQIAEVERSNSALRAELANTLTAAHVEEAAARMNMAVASPDDVGYLTANDGDFSRLAALLANDTVLTRPAPPSALEPTETLAPPAPAAPPPATTEPVGAEPAPAPPSAPSSPAPSGGGGVGL